MQDRMHFCPRLYQFFSHKSLLVPIFASSRPAASMCDLLSYIHTFTLKLQHFHFNQGTRIRLSHFHLGTRLRPSSEAILLKFKVTQPNPHQATQPNPQLATQPRNRHTLCRRNLAIHSKALYLHLSTQQQHSQFFSSRFVLYHYIIFQERASKLTHTKCTKISHCNYTSK